MTISAKHLNRIMATLSLALAGTLLGCSGPTRDISPQADDALRKMSETLARTPAFALHSTATMDQHIETGQLAQFTRNSNIVLARPDRFCADVKRGSDSFKFWHQGKEVTVLNVRKNIYATVATPANTDKMIDFLAEKYGIVLPMADLLYPDPYKVLTENVKVGTYVDQQKINDRLCHHLLFTQDNVDWQIWIDAGEKAVPRKVVITYKNDQDEPQYEAVLDEWRPALPEDLAKLTPAVPASAKRVDINELFGSEE